MDNFKKEIIEMINYVNSDEYDTVMTELNTILLTSIGWFELDLDKDTRLEKLLDCQKDLSEWELRFKDPVIKSLMLKCPIYTYLNRVLQKRIDKLIK